MIAKLVAARGHRQSEFRELNLAASFEILALLLIPRFPRALEIDCGRISESGR